MPGLDPNLVAHVVNMEPRAKPIVQPMQTFYLDVKLKLFKKSKNSSQLGSLSPSCTQSGFPTLYQSIKRTDKYDVVSTFEILIKHAPKMSSHFQT